jgi:PAS domain S-box-containing protein
MASTPKGADGEDLDCAALLPSVFQLNVVNFYVAVAGTRDPVRVLEVIGGTSSRIIAYSSASSRRAIHAIETPELVRDRVLEASRYIPIKQLGTTDDGGFAPYFDDASTTRDAAFAKIRARIVGTELASAAFARRAQIMADDVPIGSKRVEIERLRSTAMKTAELVRIARLRAERALLAVNEELARKTEELRKQREWFEVTLSSVGDAVITTDTQGHVTYLNPIAETMTGLALDGGVRRTDRRDISDRQRVDAARLEQSDQGRAEERQEYALADPHRAYRQERCAGSDRRQHRANSRYEGKPAGRGDRVSRRQRGARIVAEDVAPCAARRADRSAEPNPALRPA